VPVRIEEMDVSVDVVEGDLPFSEPQLEHVVALVARRLQQLEREAAQRREGTATRAGVAPPMGAEE
jgi:hypothetical protein